MTTLSVLILVGVGILIITAFIYLWGAFRKICAMETIVKEIEARVIQIDTIGKLEREEVVVIHGGKIWRTTNIAAGDTKQLSLDDVPILNVTRVPRQFRAVK